VDNYIPIINLTIKEIIMKKSKLLNTLVVAALIVPAMAMAEEAFPFSGNVSLTTNYLFRGISQTAGGSAIQGGFDYAGSSGLYAGVWGSSISWVSDGGLATGAGTELDTYFGYGGRMTEDVSYDVGFLRYNYPGNYDTAANLAPFAKADTNEIYGSFGWKWLTLKYSNSLGDTFGLSKASGTSYVELNASYDIEDAGISLGAHYGKQTYKGTSADTQKAAGIDPSYSDYNLSVSKDYSGYGVALTYSSTNVNKGGYYSVGQLDGSTADLGKSTVVLSLSHSM